MSPPVKRRTYESRVRREQAERTRERILQAARRLFEANGYAATTIRQVAEEAGVAVDTVYATFGSKPRLVTALIDQALTEGRGYANVMDRPEAAEVRDASTQRRQIALFARDMARMTERVGPVYEIMRTAGSADPEMAAVRTEMDSYRLRNMRRVAEWLAAKGPLRVAVDRAAQIIWTIASPDVSRMLRLGQGWSTEEYASWLEDTLARTLLGAPKRADGQGRQRRP